MREIMDLKNSFSGRLLKNLEEEITLPYTKAVKKAEESVCLSALLPKAFSSDAKCFYLELNGLNAKGVLYVNEKKVSEVNRLAGDLWADITPFFDPAHENTITLELTAEPLSNGTVTLLSARLIGLPDSHFAISGYGDTGITLTCEIENEAVRLNAGVLVEQANNYDVVDFTLTDRAGKTVARQTAKPTAPTVTLTPEAPILWDGVHSPYLYTLTCELKRDANVLDKISVPAGLSVCKLTEDGFFERNGLKLPLSGVILNSLSQTEEYLDQVILLGADVVKVTARKPTDELLTLLDERGLLLWYGFSYPSLAPYQEEIIGILRKLSEHPCAAFVEADFETAKENEEFCRLVKKHAPRLLRALPLEKGSQTQKNDPICDIFSVYVKAGMSLPEIYGLKERFDEISTLAPPVKYAVFAENPVSFFDRHSENPEKNDSSQEYAANWLEGLWNILYTRRGLVCYFAGNLTDGLEIPQRNGLLSSDAEEKKDIFWFYRAQFTSEDFIRICSAGKTMVTDKIISVRCYASAKPKEITVNGAADEKIKCRRISENVYLFSDIRLKHGNNFIVLKTEHDTDSCVVFRSRSRLKKK